MERIPLLHEPSDPHPRTQPASQMGMDHFDFEFPTIISDPGTNPALPNDIVFCGKIMSNKKDPVPPHRVRNPFLLRSESFGKLNFRRPKGSITYLQSSSTRENQRRRSSGSGSWKHHNGLFGGLKYPLQMELSDIKMRQGRREPVPLPRLPVGGDRETETGGGRKSRWDLVRRLSLRRRSPPMSALASFA